MTVTPGLGPDRPAAAFAAEVAEYLQRTPRQLPSKYFYDALGSSLFDAICRLPWYRITRAESALLERHAAAMLAAVGPRLSVAELGCGNGHKLALLLTHGAAGCADVHLVDISRDALEQARDRVQHAAPRAALHLHAAAFEDGLRRVVARRTSSDPLLVLFLGSNIGNFDPPAAHALLVFIRGLLRPGDGVLLGSDLVKPERELLVAYDDPLQVTAAFNRNLLRRINDELGGTFDLAAFAHRALWNGSHARVEMHLVSLRRQRVRVEAAGLEVTFDEGESIWTESSYKYTPAGVVADGRAAGLRCGAQWVDEDAGFALTRFSV